PPPKSLRSSSSSRSPRCRCAGRWKRLAFRAPPSTAGTRCIRPVGRRPWTTDLPSQIASGTAFQTMFASASSGWRWINPRCRRGSWLCASPTPKAILFPVDYPARLAQERGDLAVAIAAVLPGKLDNIGGEALLVVTTAWDLALRRAMLPERRTGATLGDKQLRSHLLNAGTAARGG